MPVHRADLRPGDRLFLDDSGGRGELCGPAGTVGPARSLRMAGHLAVAGEAVDPARLLSAAGDGPVVVWSGTCDDEPFGVDPRAWLPAHREVVLRSLVALAEAAGRAGQEVWVRPHARHAFGDLAVLGKLAIQRPAANVRILLDPASMLTASMLGAVDEHLERMCSVCGNGPIGGPEGVLAGIVVADVAVAEGAPISAGQRGGIDEGPPLMLVPMGGEGAGVIGKSLWESVLARRVPASVARYVVSTQAV